MEILKYVFVLFLLVGCGSKLDPKLGGQPNIISKTELMGTKVSGVLQDINQQDFYLPEATKPRIIIFSSTFCGICQAEHRNLKNLFAQNNDQLPTNIEIVTIMTESIDNVDAMDFKDFTGIQWNPYYQIGDEFRNRLCGQGTANPCVVVEKPNEGVIFQHIGEVSITELQEITGAWQW